MNSNFRKSRRSLLTVWGCNKIPKESKDPHIVNSVVSKVEISRGTQGFRVFEEPLAIPSTFIVLPVNAITFLYTRIMFSRVISRKMVLRKKCKLSFHPSNHSFNMNTHRCYVISILNFLLSKLAIFTFTGWHYK